MATYVKPGERYATSDWFTSNYVISTDAERQRVASHETRQESHYLRNETSNRTKWDQYDNNTRLADRVDHIRKYVLSIWLLSMQNMELLADNFSHPILVAQKFSEVENMYVI